jgi:hypothetical protein
MNASNDIRKSLSRLRKFKKDGTTFTEQVESTKPLDMREMLKRARRMNEDYSYSMTSPDAPSYSDASSTSNGAEFSDATSSNDNLEFNVEDMTSSDIKIQTEKIQNAFKDQDVFVKINDFKQAVDNDDEPISFFMSGGIDGVITFTMTAGKTENESGLDWAATDSYTSDQSNSDIIKRLRDYYKEFYEEWRESLY